MASGGARQSADVSLNMILRYLLIFLTALAIVTVHHVQRHCFAPRLENKVKYENYYVNDRDPDVTCKFPILHPFDESILPHIKIATPIRCFARSPVLTMMDQEGFLRFNKSGLLEAGYDDNSPPQCYYQVANSNIKVEITNTDKFVNGLQQDLTFEMNEINRVAENDFEVVYSSRIVMTGFNKPQSDFIYVNCNNFAGISIYDNFHASVQRHPSVRKFKDDTELGVAVIGLDSMSRLNFMRQLPLSYRFITENLGGVVLLGFNKVGENTFPNVIPMLTGRPCAWGSVDHYQNWPFVWKQFETEGAATMYSEDLPEFNMFDYVSTGLLYQPTLHYMRTFWLAVEKSLMFRMSSTYCMGAAPKHIVYFQYLLSFLRTYKDSPSFLFSLFNEASHDYVNTVGAIDQDVQNFLNTSFSEGLFNRTVVLILGDHGNRIDPIRLTEVGRVEDRMPMVSVVMPKWTEKAYPGWQEALQKNSKRLISSYDIHGTFLDILSTLKKPGSEDIQSIFEFEKLKETGLDTRWAKHFSAKSVELSFFHPVPVTRDCSDAGIPDWFCVCLTDQEKLSVDDERGVQAANAVVNHFNSNILRGLSQCATQELTAVDSAVLTHHKQQLTEYRVQIMFRTQPGDGVFEASVNVYTLDGVQVREVVGELLRINRYGSQADCLPADLRANSTILRGVCYCK